jgi:cytochrome c
VILDRTILVAALVIAAVSPAPAEGDPGRGERVFQYCYSCHSVEPGETNLQGPNLRGIIGRRIAAQEGFDYSPAMLAFAEREGRWSEALLDRYVEAPEKIVPKTTMSFPGIDEDDERADLLAYLRATSQNR